MKSTFTNNEIEMPLVIGAPQLSHHHKQIIQINSLNYHLTLNLKNNTILKKFILTPNQTKPFTCKYKLNSQKQIQIENDQNEDLLELNTSLIPQNNTFLIHKQLKNIKIPNQDFQLCFKVLLSSSLESNNLTIKIIQENVCFQLVKIHSNIKFVRNNILNELLNAQPKNTKGLLTMDQSSRFLLQSLTMPFPVIGFWLKTQSDLQNIQVMNHFIQFIKTKYQKKCLFKTKQSDQKYFYFVRITQQKRMETFAVSWKVDEPLKKQYSVNASANLIHLSTHLSNLQKISPSLSKNSSSLLKDSSSSILKDQTSIQNHSSNPQSSSSLKEQSLSNCQNSSSESSSSLKSQENGMNFTLRENKHKNQLSTIDSFINYSYLSPIKQLESSENSEKFFSETYHNSPQFSTLMKQETQPSESSQLKAKVKSQEIQIMKLKEIIADMQSELKLYKNSRMSTHYESNQKKPHFTGGTSSPQSNPFSLASNPTSKNSSPQVVGRLRESDLRSNSVSRSGDWLKNSSNKKDLNSRCESQNGNNYNDSNGKEIPSLFDKDYKEQKLYEQLPEIAEEDGRDPWEYMEIIDD